VNRNGRASRHIRINRDLEPKIEMSGARCLNPHREYDKDFDLF